MRLGSAPSLSSALFSAPSAQPSFSLQSSTRPAVAWSPNKPHDRASLTQRIAVRLTDLCGRPDDAFPCVNSFGTPIAALLYPDDLRIPTALNEYLTAPDRHSIDTST